jgi:L-cysteine S-thiosulfotransferase
MRRFAAAAALLLVAGVATEGGADEAFTFYRVQGDAVPAPLTGRPGDAARGAALIADRQKSLCVLCHTGPFPDPHLQGDLGPTLSGIGGRLTDAQIRLRLIDMKALNPDSIMPSYHRPSGAERVAAAWRGKPILEAGEVEDLVAYLVTLKD